MFFRREVFCFTNIIVFVHILWTISWGVSFLSLSFPPLNLKELSSCLYVLNLQKMRVQCHPPHEYYGIIFHGRLFSISRPGWMSSYKFNKPPINFLFVGAIIILWNISSFVPLRRDTLPFFHEHNLPLSMTHLDGFSPLMLQVINFIDHFINVP